MSLSTLQEERLAELQRKIKECGGPWTKALSKPERDEYQALTSLEYPKQEPMLTQEFVLNILDNLYTVCRDGDVRAVILKHKLSVQKFRIVTDNDIL